MNAVFRRRLGLVFLLVGIALLFTYAPHWAPVALGIFLVLNCLVALKKVGFRYRYIWGMVLGGFLFSPQQPGINLALLILCWLCWALMRGCCLRCICFSISGCKLKGGIWCIKLLSV